MIQQNNNSMYGRHMGILPMSAHTYTERANGTTVRIQVSSIWDSILEDGVVVRQFFCKFALFQNEKLKKPQRKRGLEKKRTREVQRHLRPIRRLLWGCCSPPPQLSSETLSWARQETPLTIPFVTFTSPIVVFKSIETKEHLDGTACTPSHL